MTYSIGLGTESGIIGGGGGAHITPTRWMKMQINKDNFEKGRIGNVLLSSSSTSSSSSSSSSSFILFLLLYSRIFSIPPSISFSLSLSLAFYFFTMRWWHVRAPVATTLLYLTNASRKESRTKENALFSNDYI